MVKEIRNEINYPEISKELVEILGLSQSPVAVKFAKSAEGIPEGIPEIDESMRHCGMVSLAAKEGKIFYATAEKHQCMGGAWALGLKELTSSLQSGEFYYKLGKFNSWAACMRTISKIPHIEAPGGSGKPVTYATVYAPLEKTPFDPHVVLIVAKPISMLKFAQACLYKEGGRLFSEFSGIQSVCADTGAYPYMTGKVNFSLGCDGSRKFSGIDDELMVMGIPAELLKEIADALPIVVGAPGSK
jgi:uncharacterized protein (DUF169 family)